MTWKNLYKRDSGAIKWLTLQGEVIKMAGVYMSGPKSEPQFRHIKPGEHLHSTPLGTDTYGASYNWAVWVDDGWLGMFDGAPEKIQKAADRLVNKTRDDIKDVRSSAIFNLPPNTRDVDVFLLSWANKEVEELEGRITGRAKKLKTFKKLYHKGPPGYKIGHTIKPYFKQDNSNLFTSMKIEAIESAFRDGFKRAKTKFGRHDVAYAFEDPEDAIRYGFGSGRAIYVVEQLGPVERRDMNAIDVVEQIFADIREEIDQADHDEEGELYEPKTKIHIDGIDGLVELSRRVIDAYWQGKAVNTIDWDVDIGEDYSASYYKPAMPVWEIVCAAGFKVVGIEDETIDESVMRKYIQFVIAEIKNEF